MKLMPMAWICAVGLLFSTYSIFAESPSDGDGNDSASNRWFMLYEMSHFNDAASLVELDVPADAQAYSLSKTLFAGKFSLGYQLTPHWSIATQLQVGPREKVEFKQDGQWRYPTESMNSHLLSLVAVRNFPVSDRFQIETKFGIARSYFEKLTLNDNQGLMKDEISEIRPVLSLGFWHKLTDKLSLGMDYTNYFTTEPENVQTQAFGLRYDF